MNRLNRRRFLALSSAGVASAVLVACGNEEPSAEELSPTQIPDVAGAPPTLAPITSTPQSSRGGGGGEQAGGQEEQGGGEQAAAGGGGGTVEVEAGDLFFEPTEFTVAPGGTIVLNNGGMLPHNLAVDEWGGDVIPELANGEKGEYTVPADAAVGDSYEFYCSVPGHKEAGMVGTVTIGEAGAGGGEAAATPAEVQGATPAAEAQSGGEQAAAGASSVEVEAGEFYFEPSEFSVSPGGTITLTNAGVLPHDFAVDEWGKVVIGPLDADASGDFTVPNDAKIGDTYEFYCSIPGHKEGGMVGKVTVA